MILLPRVRARLFGCRSTVERPYGRMYCTLWRNHPGEHEAWGCTCAGDGRCTEADEPYETWAA